MILKFETVREFARELRVVLLYECLKARTVSDFLIIISGFAALNSILCLYTFQAFEQILKLCLHSSKIIPFNGVKVLTFYRALTRESRRKLGKAN